MRPIFAAAALAFIAGCAQDKAAPPPAAPPIRVAYEDLERAVGRKVTVRAWVLGEGESYKAADKTGEHYYILQPVPEVDWHQFFSDLDAAKALAAQLEGEPDQRASAADVQEYTLMEQAVDGWHSVVRAQEARRSVLLWGRTPRALLAADYASLTDAPALLVRPTREELGVAARRVLKRYETIGSSAEFELTGELIGTGDWRYQGESVTGGFQAAVRSKPYLITAETVKMIRTARDAAKEGVGSRTASETD